MLDARVYKYCGRFICSQTAGALQDDLQLGEADPGVLGDVQVNVELKRYVKAVDEYGWQ